MANIVIYENSLGGAQFDPKTQIVHLEFKGVVSPKLGYEIFDAVLEFIKTTKVKASFHDISKLEGTFAMMNEYLFTKFFPTMVAQGHSYGAIIVSENVFTQFAIESLLQETDGNFTQTFKNHERGYQWLIESLQNKGN